MTVATDEPHLWAVTPGNYAEAVVFDLVNPVRASRRRFRRGRQARLGSAGKRARTRAIERHFKKVSRKPEKIESGRR